MKRKEAIEELKKSKRIFITLKGWGYSRQYEFYYPYLMLWVMSKDGKDGKIYPIHCEDCRYYDGRKEAYKMKVFGVDRSLELISSIAGYENCFEGLGLMKKTVALI